MTSYFLRFDLTGATLVLVCTGLGFDLHPPAFLFAPQKIFYIKNLKFFPPVAFTITPCLYLLMPKQIEVTPELGVPLSIEPEFYDLHERTAAACETISELQDHGMEVIHTSEDRDAAATLLHGYAQNPEGVSRQVTNARASTLTPASLLQLRNYLDEFGRAVVTSSVELRYLVTNRLLEESQNPDPRVRIRALELLGKISDVGLFTERAEVMITHQSTDELKQKLRDKLQKLSGRMEYPVEDATVIDVDAELGLDIEETPESGEEKAENEVVEGDSAAETPESDE